MTDRATERIRHFYERSARDYDGWMDLFDRVFVGEGRAAICGRATGRTLEIGVGTGRNIPFYPSEVELTGVDLTPGMLDIARRHSAGRAVDLRVGDAEALDLPDAAFDTVVITLCLCTVPDARKALTEVRRVLLPGGHLLLIEHVRSPIAPVRWIQRLLAPLFRLAGDDLLRDPLDHLEAVGFRVEECRRSKWGLMEEVVARAVQGVEPSVPR
jgi:ubiquinone/menaquinone biosynthesis C-methylase UbiE